MTQTPGSTPRSRVAIGIWHPDALAGVQNYANFAVEFAGASFGGGLYRVHDATTGPEALQLIERMFPEFAGRVYPFGYDWLGRQFTVDQLRLVGGNPQVSLIEGTGQILEIPCDFTAFHDQEIVEYTEAALAADFYRSWTESRGPSTLGSRECVGYRVPLFLGGQDSVDNLELSDISVYWTLCGELLTGVKGLPPENLD